MIAWLESMTRLEPRILVTRTRLESRWVKWWLDSTRITFFTEWLDSSHTQWLKTRVRVVFTKSLSSWWINPVPLHTKKWVFFASVMIKIGKNFLFWLPSRAMLQVQVSPSCTEIDLRFCIHWGQKGTIYWHLIVVECSICIPLTWQWASYCYFESLPDTNKVI